MSDIFESDMDYEQENLSALEDIADENLEGDISLNIDKPLYHLKLEYSRESIFATADKIANITPGVRVIAHTRYGLDIAVLLGESKKPYGVRKSDIVDIERIATKEDLEHEKELIAKEKDAEQIFKQKVNDLKLDMKFIAVHFLVAEQKVLFFFSADNRIDFRELVKELVSVLKMRIELRQIGVRDESRIVGGLGVCGRQYCCHSVSDKIKPVSIRMAKDQNLSLNSMKISGQCGRLLCCLSYEFDWYKEAQKKLPQEGISVFYDGTNFKIAEVNLIKSTVKLISDDGRMIDMDAKRFTKDANHRWQLH